MKYVVNNIINLTTLMKMNCATIMPEKRFSISFLLVLVNFSGINSRHITPGKSYIHMAI